MVTVVPPYKIWIALCVCGGSLSGKSGSTKWIALDPSNENRPLFGQFFGRSNVNR